MKKQTTKKKNLKAVDQKPKSLTIDEANGLERHRYLSQISSAKRAELITRESLLEKEAMVYQLLSETLTHKNESLEKEKLDLKRETDKEAAGYDKLIGEIRERLGLKGKFGFDPLTLEVVE